MSSDASRAIDMAKSILGRNADLRPQDAPLIVTHNWENWHVNYDNSKRYTPLGPFDMRQELLEERICAALRSETGSDLPVWDVVHVCDPPAVALPHDDAVHQITAMDLRWAHLPNSECEQKWFPYDDEICEDHEHNGDWYCLDMEHFLATLDKETTVMCADAVMQQADANKRLLTDGAYRTVNHDQATRLQIAREEQNTGLLHKWGSELHLYSMVDPLCFSDDAGMIRFGDVVQSAGHGCDPVAVFEQNAYRAYDKAQRTAAQWLTAVGCRRILRQVADNGDSAEVHISRATQQLLVRSLPLVLATTEPGSADAIRRDLQRLHDSADAATSRTGDSLLLNGTTGSIRPLAGHLLAWLVDRLRQVECHEMWGDMSRLAQQAEWKFNVWNAQARKGPSEPGLWVAECHEHDQWVLCVLPPLDSDPAVWAKSERADIIAAIGRICDIGLATYDDSHEGHVPSDKDFAEAITSSAVAIYERESDVVDAALRLSRTWADWAAAAEQKQL